MRSAYSSSLILFLIFGLFGNAQGAEIKYDMTTPDKTIQSFLAATKANDIKSVEAMLSPSIKQLIAKRELSIQEYVQAWTSYPIARIDKARDSSFKNDPRILAKAKVVILVNGKEHNTSVGLIKIGAQWLWNER